MDNKLAVLHCQKKNFLDIKLKVLKVRINYKYLVKYY